MSPVYVLSKLQEWFTCIENGTTANFTPLRATICGEAGSGKAVLINTLVTLILRLTKKQNSVHGCGPTGSAAFNSTLAD
jgi:predicted GTPase